ncbi:MAG: phage tail protein [Arcanobacterium sp.]|nr:phage tail protein [Arcanobacterium sp.]
MKIIDFKEVSTAGLEGSAHPEAQAGLRANEARYFWNKYKFTYGTVPAAEKPELVAWVNEILAERDLVFPYRVLEVAEVEVDGIYWPCLYYENGMAINVLFSREESGKRAVGFKLCDGMEIPEEFVGKFKFARQRSKLAGEIRGSFFVIKGKYEAPEI